MSFKPYCEICKTWHTEQEGHQSALPRLRNAIIENTKGDLFWIGEILLAELEKETGFKG